MKRINGSKGGCIHRLLQRNNLDGKWITNYVNEE